jgi:hypothetical protein
MPSGFTYQFLIQCIKSVGDDMMFGEKNCTIAHFDTHKTIHTSHKLIKNMHMARYVGATPNRFCWRQRIIGKQAHQRHWTHALQHARTLTPLSICTACAAHARSEPPMQACTHTAHAHIYEPAPSRVPIQSTISKTGRPHRSPLCAITKSRVLPPHRTRRAHPNPTGTATVPPTPPHLRLHHPIRNALGRQPSATAPPPPHPAPDLGLA